MSDLLPHISWCTFASLTPEGCDLHPCWTLYCSFHHCTASSARQLHHHQGPWYFNWHWFSRPSPAASPVPCCNRLLPSCHAEIPAALNEIVVMTRMHVTDLTRRGWVGRAGWCVGAMHLAPADTSQGAIQCSSSTQCPSPSSFLAFALSMGRATRGEVRNSLMASLPVTLPEPSEI